METMIKAAARGWKLSIIRQRNRWSASWRTTRCFRERMGRKWRARSPPSVTHQIRSSSKIEKCTRQLPLRHWWWFQPLANKTHRENWLGTPPLAHRIQTRISFCWATKNSKTCNRSWTNQTEQPQKLRAIAQTSIQLPLLEVPMHQLASHRNHSIHTFPTMKSAWEWPNRSQPIRIASRETLRTYTTKSVSGMRKSRGWEMRHRKIAHGQKRRWTRSNERLEVTSCWSIRAHRLKRNSSKSSNS